MDNADTLVQVVAIEQRTIRGNITGWNWTTIQRMPTSSYSSKKSCFGLSLSDSGRFAYDNSGIYGEATTFIMTGEELKYLCAVLNSRLIRWFLEQVAPTSGMGTLRWKKVYVQAIPVPQIRRSQQGPFVEAGRQSS